MLTIHSTSIPDSTEVVLSGCLVQPSVDNGIEGQGVPTAVHKRAGGEEGGAHMLQRGTLNYQLAGLGKTELLAVLQRHSLVCGEVMEQFAEQWTNGAIQNEPVFHWSTSRLHKKKTQ